MPLYYFTCPLCVFCHSFGLLSCVIYTFLVSVFIFVQVLPLFNAYFLNIVRETIQETNNAAGREAVEHASTWGDGLFCVFDSVIECAVFSLNLLRKVSQTDWTVVRLPSSTTVRIGLHAGPVYSGFDPLINTYGYYGRHVEKASKVEPVTTPGCVFCTEQFAACLALQQAKLPHDQRLVELDYVHTIDLEQDRESVVLKVVEDNDADGSQDKDGAREAKEERKAVVDEYVKCPLFSINWKEGRDPSIKTMKVLEDLRSQASKRNEKKKFEGEQKERRPIGASSMTIGSAGSVSHDLASSPPSLPPGYGINIHLVPPSQSSPSPPGHTPQPSTPGLSPSPTPSHDGPPSARPSSSRPRASVSASPHLGPRGSVAGLPLSALPSNSSASFPLPPSQSSLQGSLYLATTSPSPPPPASATTSRPKSRGSVMVPSLPSSPALFTSDPSALGINLSNINSITAPTPPMALSTPSFNLPYSARGDRDRDDSGRRGSVSLHLPSASSNPFKRGVSITKK